MICFILIVNCVIHLSLLWIVSFSHHPQGPQKPAMLSGVAVHYLAAVSSTLVFGEEIKEGIKPRIERRQRPCNLIAHGDHGHGVTWDSVGHLQQEEDGSGNVKGEETQSKEEGDGDDGLDGFTPAIGIWGVGSKENGHPVISSLWS